MSKHPRAKTPLQATPHLGDSWVVQSDDDDLYSPHDTDSTGSDGEEDPTSAEAARSEALGPIRNRTMEELPSRDGVGESLQKRKGRQSPRVSAGGQGSVPTPQASTRDVRSGVNPNGSVHLSPPTLASSSISTRKRQSRTSTTAISAEPDLVMPSIYEDNLGGSWRGDKKSPGRNTGTKMRRSLGDSTRSEKRAHSRLEESKLPKRFLPGSKSTLDVATSAGSWMVDVIGKALSTLKTPISLILAGYILVGILLIMRNLLTSSIYSALSPICRIPGSSFLHLPMCQIAASIKYQDSEPPPVHFDDLMAVQSQFEAVLEETAGGVSLPLDMKRSEASIRDLRQIVHHSGLRSRNELVLEFDGFIETARIASYDLQKFNSHVGRSVDNILTTARWTKRVLDGIVDLESSRGAISKFFGHRILAPFQPMRFSEDALLANYITHTRLVEEEIHRLIAEAQTLLRVLQNLEDRLDVIHGIAIRENMHLQGSKADLLSQLWTMAGGNRNKIGKFDSQLRLLGQVATYRKSAIAYVSGTMVKLQGMGAELEELRERVGGVELLGGSRGIPLSVHIENIELGVERLEKGRNRAKEIENDVLRKTQSTVGQIDGY